MAKRKREMSGRCRATSSPVARPPSSHVSHGAAGFDARRDIAGIVLNRWGHAFCAPQPGFFLGGEGRKSPPEILREPHGRIVFAHSELQGTMNMAYAMLEAHRGAAQALAML